MKRKVDEMYQNEISIKNLIQEISERDEEIKRYKSSNEFKSNYLEKKQANQIYKNNYGNNNNNSIRGNKMNKPNNDEDTISDYENRSLYRQTETGTNYNYNYNNNNVESDRNITIYGSMDLDNVEHNEYAKDKNNHGSFNSSNGNLFNL